MTKCRFNCGTEITFDNGIISKSGKKIPLHLDGSVHDCPNSPFQKKYPQSKEDNRQSFEYDQTNPNFTTADKLLQKEKVSDAIRYIEGLKDRVPAYELTLIVRERGG